MSKPTVKTFVDWVSNLSDLDQMNFNALLALGPMAIQRFPDSEYKEMAIVGLAIVETGKQSGKFEKVCVDDDEEVESGFTVKEEEEYRRLQRKRMTSIEFGVDNLPPAWKGVDWRAKARSEDDGGATPELMAEMVELWENGLCLEQIETVLLLPHNYAGIWLRKSYADYEPYTGKSGAEDRKRRKAKYIEFTRRNSTFRNHWSWTIDPALRLTARHARDRLGASSKLFDDSSLPKALKKKVAKKKS